MKIFCLVIIAAMLCGCGALQNINEANIQADTAYDEELEMRVSLIDRDRLYHMRTRNAEKERAYIKKVNQCQTQEELDQCTAQIFENLNFEQLYISSPLYAAFTSPQPAGHYPGKLYAAIKEKRESLKKAETIEQTGQSSIGYDSQKEIEHRVIMDRILKKVRACPSIDCVIEVWQDKGIPELDAKDREAFKEVAEKRTLELL